MARTALLLAVPAMLCLWSAGGSFQPALVLDMAKVLLDNYCFPENLLGMQEAIQQAINSGEILRITDRKTLAGVLSAGVQGALNDPRLAVTFEPSYVPVTTPALSLMSREQLVHLVRSSTKLEVFDNGVGYLRIDRIIGRETAAKLGQFLQDNVWNKVARTKALIFDLRYSIGGELSGMPYVISFFSDPGPPTLIETIYDRPSNTTRKLWTLPRIPGLRYGKRKDLIVLTSKRTNGAAEAVASALKNRNRAIVIGERTSGGSVKVDKIRIDRSGFYITVPTARSSNPVTGQSWEVNGVSPSVSVRPKEAVTKAKALLAAREGIPKAVRSVSNLIKRYYASKDKVKVLLNHLETTDFFAVISEEDLAAKLNYELQSVCEDPRLIIKTTKAAPVAAEDPEAPDDSNLNTLVDEVFKVQIRPSKTAYLQFDRFLDAATLSKLEDQMVQKVWEPIRDTDNLVIDLRSNSGGPSEGLSIILSYLHDRAPPLHFFTIYDSIQNTTTEYRTSPAIRGPTYGSKRNIYVLVGCQTAAAGEEFAYLMQSLRRGTVIGEITSGNLLHSRSFLAEGTGIVATVPVVNFVDNNGECWLGGGVVPDAIVLADEAEEMADEIIRFHGETHGLVEGAGQILEDHYALPEVAGKVSSDLRAKWQDGSYRSVVDYESLASQLTSDLQEASGDHRLHVFYCDVEPEAMMQEYPKIPSNDEAGYIIDALCKIDLLPGNVGYLRVDMMPDVEVLKVIGPQLIQQVWSKLVNTRALVLDMRYNTGGHSSAIPLLCTYLFAPEPLRHLYTVFDRSSSSMSKVMTLPQVVGQRYGSEKDVYVLTSHMTGSAAEVFTRTLSDLHRATVVGEPTIGGSLSSGMYQIGSSILYASVPNQVVLSAVSGKLWSVSGLEPDAATQASDALNVAKRIIAAKQLKQDSKS
ncbi:retinol-binding protein 3 [Clupea harengus]|uniref:Retinol-binding protein 3 n=1 Tax=Clupea harengus TaxID=7950 RepID=A0A6P3VMD5_CLUHA|nr:retinol-binding protein 3 [Clupea harengus]